MRYIASPNFISPEYFSNALYIEELTHLRMPSSLKRDNGNGYGTTSALFNDGKIKCVNVFRENPELNEVVHGFKNPNADPEIIAKTGERSLLGLYNYRYVRFTKSA
ncbi:hypothetical protein JTB14_012041 [Gonioctena quinquepunctata]|nr:hypothetical protein JTB14_012041 [Gonioctena quinquepunctata]